MKQIHVKPVAKNLTLAIATALLLSACGGDDSSNSSIINTDSTNSTNPSEQANVSIQGTLIDKETLEPINNALIKFSDQQVMTSEDGVFEIPLLETQDSVTFTVIADNYPERVFTTSLAGSLPMQVEYQISNDASIASVVQSSNEDIIVVVDSYGAQVTIPANTLQRADGQPIVGDVRVTLDAVTPSIDPEEMPGGYVIVGGGFMESFGALIITATDSNGNALVLTDDNTASVIIPVSTRSPASNLLTQMPLFYYAPEDSGWVQRGTATLITLENGQPAYIAEVDNIGAWNVDVAMQTVGVNGCVADTDGNRIPNALVKGDGISYSSLTTATTNNLGEFYLPVRETGDLYVYAQNGNRSSNAISISTMGNDYTIENGCLIVSNNNDTLSIRLTWGEQPYDADAHLITPSGDHIYFEEQGSLSQAPFANLDVDDIDSYGPEFITVRNLMVGRYKYGVHNYENTKNPGLKDSPISIQFEGPTVRKRTLAPTLNDQNNDSYFWHAFDFVVDDQCNITFESIDQWLNENDTEQQFDILNRSEPKYCISPSQ